MIYVVKAFNKRFMIYSTEKTAKIPNPMKRKSELRNRTVWEGGTESCRRQFAEQALPIAMIAMSRPSVGREEGRRRARWSGGEGGGQKTLSIARKGESKRVNTETSKRQRRKGVDVLMGE